MVRAGEIEVDPDWDPDDVPSPDEQKEVDAALEALRLHKEAAAVRVDGGDKQRTIDIKGLG